MIEVRYVEIEDKEFWYSLDKHLPEREFENIHPFQDGNVVLEDLLCSRNVFATG